MTRIDEKALAKVKALEWEPFYTNDGRECAETPLGETYHVSDEGWWNPLAELHECDGKGAAKAAAQADYERRILSALEPAPAEAAKVKALEDWHEDDGYCVWWTWQDGQWLGEPSYIGSPLCDDWPDYHTHWSPHPSFPPAPAGKE